ncbi:histone-lysine N-methyltransferase SUV420H [Fonsecaea erecta]|uniref:Histone-lysine N-methyltransferase SET9 n=1 Tax=Fonsecaea erecta TaxID=1367422 RepID=A0A178ZPU8_9EURO|nr:histone-lysine N-methyltransferase SUV420H [Fonsecaea erecta]OAP61817.1 histone-lysine N-methyltransferase SUV420H [Fonsecaea erecta]
MARGKGAAEPEKTRRLSLAELAAHDDVCSDVMIDNAYYKSRIRKNRTKHIPIRGIKEDEVPQILLHKVIVDKDVKAAEKALLSLPGLKRYRKSLRSKSEQEHFLNHLRKYIDMYQTDCAWEVSTTNRYTITTYEAAVTARRRIRQGDTIKYLTGTLVPLTTEESADLDLTNRNFSIVVSSRKKNSSIFLGPARFANHDCDANGRLVTRGENGMEVVAMKNIEVGDEITVSYGDDYFGPGNIDCLCHTCEQLERNGWTSKAGILDTPSRTSTPLEEPEPAVHPRGLKRKRDSNPSPSSSAPPLKYAKAVQSPSKLQHSWTPSGSSDAETPLLPIERKSEPLVAASEVGTTLSPPHSPSRPGKHDSGKISVHLDGAEPRQKSPGSSMAHADDEGSWKPAQLLSKIASHAPLSPASTSPSSHGSTAGVSASRGPVSQVHNIDTAVTIKMETVETMKIEDDDDDDCIVVFPAKHTDEILRQSQEQPIQIRPIVESTTLGIPPTVPGESVRHFQEQHKQIHPLTGSTTLAVPHAISTLSTTTISKEVRAVQPPGATIDENSVLPSIEPMNTSSTVAKLTVHPVTGTIRIAGDYILTRKLLAQPHDRWVQCHNEKCFGFFIQPNGYQTRRECPRCERHSMLYGFPWPKTDPDPRKLLERKSQGNGRGKKNNAEAIEYSAYRRKGRCGKGTWVEGGGDPEERVMDHRTIHRFVLPEEERELTRKGLLKDAEVARAAGDHALAILEARMRAGSSSRVLNHGMGTESATRDASESGSATPDELRRRSNRFVTRPVGIYTDKF